MEIQRTSAQLKPIQDERTANHKTLLSASLVARWHESERTLSDRSIVSKFCLPGEAIVTSALNIDQYLSRTPFLWYADVEASPFYLLASVATKVSMTQCLNWSEGNNERNRSRPNSISFWCAERNSRVVKRRFFYSQCEWLRCETNFSIAHATGSLEEKIRS